MPEVELPNHKELHEFYFAIVAAILGALFALNGFFMIIPVPLFH